MTVGDQALHSIPSHPADLIPPLNDQALTQTSPAKEKTIPPPAIDVSTASASKPPSSDLVSPKTVTLEVAPSPQAEKENADPSDDEIMISSQPFPTSTSLPHSSSDDPVLAAISRCNFLKNLVSHALPPSNDFSPDREPEVPSRIELEIALGTLRSFLSNVYDGVAETNMELIFDAARTLYLAPQLTRDEAQFWRHFQQTYESFVADFHHVDGIHDHQWYIRSEFTRRKISLDKDASKALEMTTPSHNELSLQRRLTALEAEAARIRAELADLENKRIKEVQSRCDLIEKETKELIATRDAFVQANRDHDYADLQLARKEAEFYAWSQYLPAEIIDSEEEEDDGEEDHSEDEEDGQDEDA